MSDNNVMAVVM